MATKPKSYRKGDYIYTESSPGSNKYQNFTAAKPTVKQVRDESKKDKAVVAAKKVSTPKPGENKMSSGEATRKTSRMGGMDTGNVMKAKPSATSSATRANRQGGMDTGNVMKKSSSQAVTYTKDAPGSSAEAYRGPVPEKERMRIATAPTKREINAIFGVTGISRVIAGMGRNLANRGLRTVAPKMLEGAKKLLEGPKKATRQPQEPRQLKGPEPRKLLTGPKARPKLTKSSSSPSRPFPKGKGTYRGKRTPGTYTAN